MTLQKTMKRTGNKMDNLVGVVASGSGSQEISFFSQNAIRTDYIAINNGQCRTIYRISNVEIVNKRFAAGDFIRYIAESDDYSKYNIYIAHAVPVASIDAQNQKYDDYWYIAPPGSRVKMATSEDIAIAHGIAQAEGTQKIGYLKRREDVQVWVDFRRLLITHMAIVGRSGQGKSNFTKIILSKLPMQYMVFTPTNEYCKVDNAKHIDANGFTLPVEIGLLKKIFGLNDSETSLLSGFLDNYVLPKTMDTRVLADAVYDYYKNGVSNTARRLTERSTGYVSSLCEKMKEVELKIGAKSNIIPKESYIFNMQKLSQNEQEILIYLYLNQLLNFRRENFKMVQEGEELSNRIVIFLEEAHNYIPSMKSSFCKDIINCIAREGRKLGIHLVLLSQRPRYLDPTTLSQCGSVASFHLANPDDIEYIMSNANFYDDTYKRSIQDLKIGECILVSDYLEKGILCKVSLSE